jgi:hypothetical protein
MVLVIALLLAAYGLYIGSFIPAMLIAPVPVLLVAYLLQAVAAFAAAYGVGMRRAWATTAIIVLGASVAATWLIEAFALGIVAYLHALAVAVLAVVLAMAGAAYLRHRHVTP